jgi:subtilisin-like proprotein convertase family protein
VLSWPIGGNANVAYRPASVLSDFHGRSANGSWTLPIIDHQNQSGMGDLPTLSAWQLRICTTPVP